MAVHKNYVWTVVHREERGEENREAWRIAQKSLHQVLIKDANLFFTTLFGKSFLNYKTKVIKYFRKMLSTVRKTVFVLYQGFTTIT